MKDIYYNIFSYLYGYDHDYNLNKYLLISKEIKSVIDMINIKKSINWNK
jgi:hypothetical protein